jgi:RNA polymerase sigma-70 factor (ECF subfamily)
LQEKKILNGEKVDSALVKRVQNGDKKAFDMLVHKYQQKVINLVYRYVHSREEAQDIAQDTFIKAYRAIANFRGDSAFYTWLYRIAINTAKNYLSSLQRKAPCLDVDITDIMSLDQSASLRDDASPEYLLQRDDTMQAILQAIEALPEDFRSAITLREMEGLNYEDIAEVLDCPVGTVRSRIFRARETINQHLQELGVFLHG